MHRAGEGGDRGGIGQFQLVEDDVQPGAARFFRQRAAGFLVHVAYEHARALAGEQQGGGAADAGGAASNDDAAICHFHDRSP